MSLADKLRKTATPTRNWKPRPEILLHPQTPQPLHGVVPRAILGAKWWDATRKAAYKSTDYHCLACGVSKWDAKLRRWLEAHECYAINYRKGTMLYLEAVPLCHSCHNYIHAGRLQALLEKGEIHQAKFAAIIQHGDAVLAAAKLVKPPPYSGKMANWHKWRLLLEINGELTMHPPILEKPVEFDMKEEQW